MDSNTKLIFKERYREAKMIIIATLQSSAIHTLHFSTENIKEVLHSSHRYYCRAVWITIVRFTIIIVINIRGNDAALLDHCWFFLILWWTYWYAKGSPVGSVEFMWVNCSWNQTYFVLKSVDSCPMVENAWCLQID